MNTSLALVIDGDNAQLHHTKQIIQFCENQGILTVKKAYGDWNIPPLSSHRQMVADLGIELVQQDRIGKNATDIKLATEVRAMLDNMQANIYFLVSSDGDFAPVCQQIRLKGAKAIVIGKKKGTSNRLKKICNQLVYVETIIKNQ